MPCDWPVDRSCYLALPPNEDPSYDARLAAQNAAEDLAVSVLWFLSSRRFGICEATARPCPPPPRLLWDRRFYTGDPASPFIPMFWGGEWRNFSCGCPNRCQVSSPHAVHLPGPCVDIVTVTIGDTVLDEEDYKLEGNVLYRVNGGDWPRQDLNRPMGSVGTWSVIYDRGEAVPPGVDALTGELAREFLLAASGGKCRLPRNITGVTRNGVSYQVYNPVQLYATGKTGLAEVDLWLASINPHQLMSAPTVR